MKAVPFDAFGSPQAVCTNVAHSAPLAAGVALPKTAWHVILKTARDTSLLDKKIGDLMGRSFS
jgi:hypothetical protein